MNAQPLAPNLDAQKRLLGILNLQFFTVTSQGVGGATPDILVTLPNWARFIMCVGATKITDSCYMHFDKLNRTYGSNTIPVTGLENWFPFSSNAGTGLSKIGVFYKFRHPMPPIIYFDLGQESGSQNSNTFVVSDDDIEMSGSQLAQI